MAVRAITVAAAAVLCCALLSDDPSLWVLPPPRRLSAGAAARVHVRAFDVASDALHLTGEAPASQRLMRAVNRFSARLLRRSGVGVNARLPRMTLNVSVASSDEYLGARTDYSHALELNEGADGCIHAAVRSNSVYGAISALESLSQLLTKADDVPGLVLPALPILIEDAPSFAWRGLMLDTGRRFIPPALVNNLLDTMAAVKMSVLHLHASDHCRFSVQSFKYPNLTAALTGILGGFYLQSDITAMIAYAGDRGIRVVPEFDVPGHSRGFLPLQPDGIVFCDPQDATVSQLYGDPNNQTYNILTNLFSEMAGLFTDEVFDIGCDETAAIGPCTTQTTFDLERRLLNFIQGSLGKRPSGWEEVLFDANAATNNTIVDTWARYQPNDAISRGYSAIASSDAHFYFTEPAPMGPAGWSTCWYDISTGVAPVNISMLLGGEASMWTDTYCYIDQCGSSSGSPPVAAALFGPDMDAPFSASLGGMIWPRGYVAASAFWNYNASVDPSSPSFVSAIWSLNDQLIAGGAYACPSNCACDQLTACGEPYVQPNLNGNLTTATCTTPVPPTQAFVLTADGYLALVHNASLCVALDVGEQYPLQMAPCGAATASVWTHDKNTSEIVRQSDGLCLDLMTSNGFVGTWTCGSGSGLHQANQAWAFDSTSGVIMSFATGECVTV